MPTAPTDFMSTIFIGGIAFGLPAEVKRANPKKEYVAGGSGLFSPQLRQVLPRGIDDVTSDFGSYTYEAMQTDPAVMGSFTLLKLAVMAEDWQIEPSVRAKPGEEPGAKETQAEEIAQYCRRTLLGLDHPFEDFLFQMLDAMVMGNKLAEKVCEIPDEGEDKGQLTLRSLKIKPRWAWAFVVDVFKNIKGLLAFTPEGGPAAILDRSKFAIFAWRPRENDPRGTSILRPAYSAWNLKTQMWPQFYKYLVLFGTPGLVGEVAPGSTSRPATAADLALNPLQAEVSAEQDMTNDLVAFQGGTAIGIANGAKVYPIQASGNGEAFHKAEEILNREIVRAIVLDARATLEAQHGSKADSEKSQDSVGLYVRFIRQSLQGWVNRDILRWMVELRYGPEIAAEFTPSLSLGGVEHQDFPATAAAIAQLMKAAYLTPSQLPQCDELMGLKIREPGEQPVAQVNALALQDAKVQAKGDPNAPKPGSKDTAA